MMVSAEAFRYNVHHFNGWWSSENTGTLDKISIATKTSHGKMLQMNNYSINDKNIS